MQNVSCVLVFVIFVVFVVSGETFTRNLRQTDIVGLQQSLRIRVQYAKIEYVKIRAYFSVPSVEFRRVGLCELNRRQSALCRNLEQHNWYNNLR